MGYVIVSIEEVEKIIRTVGLYAIWGLSRAETAEQKQFMLERIVIELGMNLQDIRNTFYCAKGEEMDLSQLIETWEDREAKRLRNA